MPHGVVTSHSVTFGIRAALAISRSPRCQLAKSSNAVPHKSLPFRATSGTNRQVLTLPSVRTELGSVCTRIVGKEFVGEIVQGNLQAFTRKCTLARRILHVRGHAWSWRWENFTDRNRDTQDMCLYTNIDYGYAKLWEMCFRDVHVGNTMVLDPLVFKQADQVEFGELVASQGLNVEERIRSTLHILVGNYSRSPDEPKTWRNQLILSHFH